MDSRSRELKNPGSITDNVSEQVIHYRCTDQTHNNEFGEETYQTIFAGWCLSQTHQMAEDFKYCSMCPMAHSSGSPPIYKSNKTLRLGSEIEFDGAKKSRVGTLSTSFGVAEYYSIPDFWVYTATKKFFVGKNSA